MKSIVIFYDDEKSSFADEKVFGGFSAIELSKKWAETLCLPYFYVKAQTFAEFLGKSKKIAQENSASSVLFSYNDLPFLNVELTEKILSSHEKYKSEYTFADGYPYGFAPELVDSGTLGILFQLAETSQKELGNQKVSRESIFNLIKTDINSFEVDAVLSMTDWRLYRFAFHCGTKENFLQCKGLFDEACGKIDGVSAENLSRIASTSTLCLKTVPAFYNIQIADGVRLDSIYSPYKSEFQKKNGRNPFEVQDKMDFEKYCKLLNRISDFSSNAVIGFSVFGEPFLNPQLLQFIEKTLLYPEFSLFIETDGLSVSAEFCENLKKIVEKSSKLNNLWPKIMICVKLDAFSVQTYKNIHKNAEEDDFQKAVSSVALLNQAVPGCAYPQFVRMNENEEELESFYRFWSDKNSPSGGKIIVQKYENFCHLLEQRKPADLSPLERNVCWHLRRDLTIYTNGDVPFCRQCVFSKIIGNVFTESLEEIWKKTDEAVLNQINGKYPFECEECDEFYTYNF